MSHYRMSESADCYRSACGSLDPPRPRPVRFAAAVSLTFNEEIAGSEWP